MSCSSRIRAAAIALSVFAGIGFSSAAQAETCDISFSVIKAGWVIGGSAGSGMMRCRRGTFPITIGGLSAGFLFGASETTFRGSATFWRSPYEVAGVYGAAGAGAAVVIGGQGIVLRNEKGATLSLVGSQVGLQVNADLSGLALSMR